MERIKLKGADALREEKIPRLVVSFAITTLIALTFNSLYTLTDALFVSWGVGDNAMGGVSIVFPFVILQSAISTAIGGGAASLVSRRLGEGNAKESGEITFNAMIAFYITAVIITLIGFVFMEPLLHAFGVTDELYSYAKRYFIVVLAGNVFSTGFSSIIRAEGKKIYALLIWVIPVSVNIVLDAVFILLLGWGVLGSAVATVIAQFTSFSMCVVFFIKFTSQDFKGIRLRLKRIGEILAIGLPSLVQIGSLSIITLVLNNVLKNVSGTLGVNTFAYMSKLITFALVPFTALAQAIMPIVGYNHGAKRQDRAVKTLIVSCAMALAYSLIALVFAECIPHIFMRIFTKDTQIIAMGAQGLRIVAVSIVFIPIPTLYAAYLQANGKKLWSLILYGANLIFLIPLVYIMSKPLGMTGVWWAYVISYVLVSIIGVARMAYEKGKSKIAPLKET